MAFINVPGLKGKIYVPEETPGREKKHDCRDCYSCQMCSDVRCEICFNESLCTKNTPLEMEKAEQTKREEPLAMDTL